MSNLYANWPAPANVFALTTLRTQGSSKAPYDANNLGLHVGDNPHDVNANREALRLTLERPQDAEWLEQIHSDLCVVVEEDPNRVADAAITRSAKHTLAIMTADCLPIMLCNKQGTEVAAIHSGWRGLANGIVENTLSKMHSSPDQLLAWIGPAICQSCYEVGGDVLDAYQARYSFAPKAFKPQGEKWLANLPHLAEQVLNSLGVLAVFQSKICTFEQKKDFYSYRRTPQTGRMATLIWFNEINQDK
ncbi:peptidoglycan editing factor PgeF [Legionella massiliensis]|uniref:peptidoglycan editing factor PgeF n=1 Tax=Legionella massiliensis TaxID=1034943 RepID=UPI0005C75650|nr:peptidoglycan editing factor PgeF [Legionella massiliensis]